MKKYLLWTLILGLLSFMASCIESFTPEINQYENNLVVEGNVIEGEFPAKVRLSRSFAFDEREPLMISNAQVLIRDDQGLEILLPELEAGLYQTDSSQFEGVAGRSYQLHIQLAGGDEYESDWMLLKAGVPIDQITATFDQRLDDQGSVSGMVMAVDAEDPSNQSKYYRWEYEETWQFRVPYPAQGVWNRQTHQADLYPFTEIPALCWRSRISSEILLHTTEGLEEDRVVSFPIRYVTGRGNELYTKYSILAKQYVITAQTYEYWRNIKRVSEDLGGLFDPVPSEVIGNIHNLNDPSEPVLGFFSADGFTTKRIFVRRTELPDFSINSGYRECELDTIDSRTDMSKYVVSQGVYVDDVINLLGLVVGFSGTRKRCADCRTEGTMEKPDFWE